MVGQGLVIYISLDFKLIGKDAILHIKKIFQERMGYKLTVCYVNPQTFIDVLECKKVIENVRIKLDTATQRNNFHCLVKNKDEFGTNDEEKERIDGT